MTGVLYIISYLIYDRTSNNKAYKYNLWEQKATWWRLDKHIHLNSTHNILNLKLTFTVWKYDQLNQTPANNRTNQHNWKRDTMYTKRRNMTKISTSAFVFVPVSLLQVKTID